MLFLVGCRNYGIPQADTTHPANPQATFSMEIKQVQTLEIDKNDLPEIPREIKKKNMKQM
jgi:hypothetical protein